MNNCSRLNGFSFFFLLCGRCFFTLVNLRGKVTVTTASIASFPTALFCALFFSMGRPSTFFLYYFMIQVAGNSCFFSFLSFSHFLLRITIATVPHSIYGEQACFYLPPPTTIFFFFCFITY